MKGKRYSTEEKVRILREADGGDRSIVDICREKNISDVTFHRWKRQFGQMDLNEARRLKELERENTELKKMLADAMLAKKVLEYALEKKL
jgi:putative transposase